MRAVLRLNLPINAALMQAMRRYFVPEFLAEYPQTAHNEYKQGRWIMNYDCSVIFDAIEKGESNNAQNWLSNFGRYYTRAIERK